MFEYIFVFIVVAIAGWYVARSLWKETKGGGCVGCDCKSKGLKSQNLIQIKNVRSKY